jgi:ABC-2 type transport system permease protein
MRRGDRHLSADALRNEPITRAPSMFRSVRKYLKILRVSLVERLTYRADFFVATLFRFLPLITTFLLWDAVYSSSQKEQISGFTRDRMLAYLLLVQISRMFSSMPGLAAGIARDIREGTLKKYLLQPIDMTAYLLAYRGAHKLAYIATSALPYGLLFAWFHSVFPPFPDVTTLLAYVASLVMAFLLGFFFEAAIGMVGFWLLEVTSFLYIVNTLNFFISGQMFPLDMISSDVFMGGDTVRLVLKSMPFAYLAYYPARIYLGMVPPDELALGLLFELAWVIVMMAATRILYRRGLRHYSAFGG